MNITKWDAVNDMVFGIEEYAKEKGVSIKGNIPEDVNDLDDLFNDGGEGRCEHFVDLAYDYAGQFGPIEDYDDDNGFEAHVWKCIDAAMKRLTKKYGSKEETEE